MINEKVFFSRYILPIRFCRGAEIIEDLRQKQIEHRQQHENEILVKIKRNMERIRATQQKMLKPIDKPTHFDGELSFHYFFIPKKKKHFFVEYICILNQKYIR